MKTKQRGFTLIELVVVIVLLGIIGAVATARFQDMAGAAASSVVTGVAAELASANAINFAKAAADGAPTVTLAGAAAVNCNTLGPLFQNNVIPTGITLTGSIDCNVPTMGQIGGTCTVSRTGTATTATVQMFCTG